MAEPVCVQVTAEQRATLVSLGWTVVSGPHANEEECLLACGTTGTGTGTAFLDPGWYCVVDDDGFNCRFLDNETATLLILSGASVSGPYASQFECLLSCTEKTGTGGLFWYCMEGPTGATPGGPTRFCGFCDCEVATCFEFTGSGFGNNGTDCTDFEQLNTTQRLIYFHDSVTPDPASCSWFMPDEDDQPDVSGTITMCGHEYRWFLTWGIAGFEHVKLVLMDMTGSVESSGPVSALTYWRFPLSVGEFDGNSEITLNFVGSGFGSQPPDNYPSSITIRPCSVAGTGTGTGTGTAPSRDCYLLSDEGLAEMEDAGYTQVSGPHTTLEECQVSCESTGTGTGTSDTGTGTGTGSGTGDGTGTDDEDETKWYCLASVTKRWHCLTTPVTEVLSQEVEFEVFASVPLTSGEEDWEPQALWPSLAAYWTGTMTDAAPDTEILEMSPTISGTAPVMSIPTTANILGLEVRVARYHLGDPEAMGDAQAIDTMAVLTVGSDNGDDKSKLTPWAPASGISLNGIYGSSSDLWGISSPSIPDLNSGNLKFSLKASATDLDTVQIENFFSLQAGGSGSIRGLLEVFYASEGEGERGCYNLSESELADRIADGYGFQGSFDTSEQCIASCFDSGTGTGASTGTGTGTGTGESSTQDCYLLTIAEKNAMVASGDYEEVSGPHDTLEECQVSCSDTGTGTGTSGTGTGTGTGTETGTGTGTADDLPDCIQFTIAGVNFEGDGGCCNSLVGTWQVLRTGPTTWEDAPFQCLENEGITHYYTVSIEDGDWVMRMHADGGGVLWEYREGYGALPVVLSLITDSTGCNDSPATVTLQECSETGTGTN